MEAICFSETAVETRRTTRRHIPEDYTLHNHRCENLKSYMKIFSDVRPYSLVEVHGRLGRTSVSFCQITRRRVSEDTTIYTKFSFNLIYSVTGL
jgi:hypothetical protein